MSHIKNALMLLTVFLLVAACAPEPLVSPTPEKPTEEQIVVEPTVVVATPAEAEAQDEPTEQATTQAAAAEMETPTSTASPQEETETPEPSLSSEDDLIRFSMGDPSSDMVTLINQLTNKGVISTNDGQYFQMNDLILRWARINWYKAWFTPIAPESFVVNAHVKWFAASKNANSFNSGCGFAFHAQDEDNHYMAFIALDGYVYLWRVIYGRPSVLSQGWYNFYTAGEKNEEGIWVSEADITLAVEGIKFTFFVDGKEMWTRYDPVLEDGNLALALASGINTGFGTQCEFSDTEIFVLEDGGGE